MAPLESQVSPVQWLPDEVDVKELLGLVLRVLLQVDEGEVSVVDARSPLVPPRDVFGEEQLVGEGHGVGTARIII